MLELEKWVKGVYNGISTSKFMKSQRDKENLLIARLQIKDKSIPTQANN